MKTITFMAFFLTVFLGSSAFAETTLNAQVDKTELAAGQLLTYRLTVDSTEKKLPSPQLPKFEGFSVVSQAQSSNVSLIKNEVTIQYLFVFSLMPLQAGKYTIGPATVTIKDKAISTREFQIEVLPSEESVPPGMNPPESSQYQITL